MTHTIYTIGQRPDLADETFRINRIGWPRFMLNDPVADRYWNSLFGDFAAFQFVLCDESAAVIAAGHSIPLVWDGTVKGLPASWDAELEQGVDDRAAQRAPNTLGALGITVDPAYQGQGLSRVMLEAMRGIAADHGLRDLIAPVRPTLKARYPLTPIERYAAWIESDGAPFDPWLRTHWRLGARSVRLAPQSMIIEAPVAKWEEWTGMRFPDSGQYIVPSALQPVTIDRERDIGRYEDPNVWMRHTIDGR
jgi:GNAT superfamily N-acetyltransferase